MIVQVTELSMNTIWVIKKVTELTKQERMS